MQPSVNVMAFVALTLPMVTVCVQALWDVVKREVDLHRQSNLLEHYQAAFARIKVRSFFGEPFLL